MALINIFQDKFDDCSKYVILMEQKWVQIFNIFKGRLCKCIKSCNSCRVCIMFTGVRRVNKESIFFNDNYTYLECRSKSKGY